MAMLPVVRTHLGALAENLRLLEILVTGPLGLYSDIKMLRESMPVDGTEDLDRAQQRERRLAVAGAATDTVGLALTTVGSAKTTLDALANLNESGGSPLPAEWTERARRVLARAADKVGGDARSKIAERITGLYVILDPEVTAGRPLADVASAALRGGASTLQLRDKSSDKSTVLESARELADLCNKHGALFIVNDDADIAVLSGADGLHVGQEDLSTDAIRSMASSHLLIGRSTTNLDQALKAQADGVDYIAVGPVFATETMAKGGKAPVGAETVEAVRGRVSCPVVAIGGIKAESAPSVIAAGANAICVASAVTLADDPEAASRALVTAAG